jgi:hypothetical protein
MRLDIEPWSLTATALELIPCQRVRPSAAYFAAGHRLLDSLTRPLPVRVPVQQRPDQEYLRAAVSRFRQAAADGSLVRGFAANRLIGCPVKLDRAGRRGPRRGNRCFAPQLPLSAIPRAG